MPQHENDIVPADDSTTNKKVVVSLLVAADEHNLIGRENSLPWHLPADLKYFRNLTWGMPILMGRKTFESIGKPLPGRKNIVITRNKDWQHEGVAVAHTLPQAVQLAKADDIKELFIIGGAEIFATGLPAADRLYITRIHQVFEGDVYFPPMDGREWHLVSSTAGKQDEKNPYPFTFQVWERITSDSQNGRMDSEAA